MALYGVFKRLQKRLGSMGQAAKVLGISECLFSQVITRQYPYEAHLEKRLAPRLDELRRHPPVRPVAPARDTARARVWQSMRILRKFTLGDLVATSEVHYDGVRHFVRHLVKVGIVVLAKRHGNQASQMAVFRLAMDLGPKAPQVQRDGKGIFDPNHDQTFVPAVREKTTGTVRVYRGVPYEPS